MVIEVLILFVLNIMSQFCVAYLIPFIKHNLTYTQFDKLKYWQCKVYQWIGGVKMWSIYMQGIYICMCVGVGIYMCVYVYVYIYICIYYVYVYIYGYRYAMY